MYFPLPNLWPTELSVHLSNCSSVCAFFACLAFFSPWKRTIQHRHVYPITINKSFCSAQSTLQTIQTSNWIYTHISNNVSFSYNSLIVKQFIERKATAENVLKRNKQQDRTTSRYFYIDIIERSILVNYTLLYLQNNKNLSLKREWSFS